MKSPESFFQWFSKRLFFRIHDYKALRRCTGEIWSLPCWERQSLYSDCCICRKKGERHYESREAQKSPNKGKMRLSLYPVHVLSLHGNPCSNPWFQRGHGLSTSHQGITTFVSVWDLGISDRGLLGDLDQWTGGYPLGWLDVGANEHVSAGQFICRSPHGGCLWSAWSHWSRHPLPFLSV